MKGLQVTIIEFIDDSQPGWVRCKFVDAYGKEWSLIEKVPIVTQEDINEKSQYPQLGFVAGEIKKITLGTNYREITTIDISKPWAVKAIDGETVFDVFSDQLIDVFL